MSNRRDDKLILDTGAHLSTLFDWLVIHSGEIRLHCSNRLAAEKKMHCVQPVIWTYGNQNWKINENLTDFFL